MRCASASVHAPCLAATSTSMYSASSATARSAIRCVLSHCHVFLVCLILSQVYNVFKLVNMLLGDDFKPLAWNKMAGAERPQELWILSRLSHTIETMNKVLLLSLLLLLLPRSSALVYVWM